MRCTTEFTNYYEIRHKYDARWNSLGFIEAKDMMPFGPEVTWPIPGALMTLRQKGPKPVKYAPVKRRGGVETFPPVDIVIALREPDGPGELGRAKESVDPKKWDGAKVEVEVVNLWAEPPTGKKHDPRMVKLEGVLRNRECHIKVDEKTVQEWLDPEGPLRARVNENLLEFRFRIPTIKMKNVLDIPLTGQTAEEDAGPLVGESGNRLYFYRRKNIVFFPGAFGSQVQVKTGRGEEILGFPDFVNERFGKSLALTALSPALAASNALDALRKQRIAVLECDAGGKPLAQPKEPKILMMTVPLVGHQVVYSVFDCMREAVGAHVLRQLPEGFRLFTLHIAAYDWRCDLTETAKVKLEDLKRLQNGPYGRGAPDTDDELVLVGHSTGGLVIRRIMAEIGNPNDKKLVSHAFFMAVPFRGSAKCTAVVPTGCDPLPTDSLLPLLGSSMIPFIDPKSIAAIALTAPIVYHLSTSPAYGDPVFILKGAKGKTETLRGHIALKRWTELAIETGFMPSRRVIPKGDGLSREERLVAALNADSWDEYWRARWEHRLATTVRRWCLPLYQDDWEARELKARKLEGLNAERRVEQGFSDELAGKAAEFHAACEGMAKGGLWAKRAFVFYSVSKAPTTLALEARLESSKVYTDKLELMKELNLHPRNLPDLRPPEKKDGKPEKRYPEPEKDYGLVEKSVRLVESFQLRGNEFVRERWRLAVLRQIDGDGTVPLKSALGFGGKVQVFRRLAEDDGSGPEHVAVPNQSWAWSRIVEVLMGHDVKEHLTYDGEAKLDEQSPVDPVEGIDQDQRLDKLRLDYWLS